MKNQNFRESEIAENLSHIKVLTNYKTEHSRQTSPYFIIWGCIWIIAYSVSLFKVPSVVLACVWFVLAVLGWILTLKTYLKQKQSDPMPTFLKNQLKCAWFGFILMVSIFVFLILMELLPRTGEFFIVFNCFNGVYYVYILRHRFNKRDFCYGILAEYTRYAYILLIS